MTRPATMSAVHVPRHGGPAALVWRDDLPVPRPGAGEVLVQVRAAGVQPTVSKTYPLRKIARAQADLAEGRFPGKLVLQPEASDA